MRSEPKGCWLAAFLCIRDIKLATMNFLFDSIQINSKAQTTVSFSDFVCYIWIFSRDLTPKRHSREKWFEDNTGVDNISLESSSYCSTNTSNKIFDR